MEKEIDEIKKKYEKVMEPLFEKRSTIVSGSYEPIDEETKAKDEHTVENLTSDPTIKGIPNFWLNVLKNDQEFGEIVQETDFEALAHLTNIIFVDTENEGYTAEFHFSENPFFSNTVIKKTIIIKEEEETVVVENTPIQFKEGKDFTVRKVTKTVKAKGKGKKPASSTKVVEEQVPGFFADFLCPVANDEEEPAQINYLQSELCGKLREIIVPNAILFFLDKADQFNEMGYGDDYDFDEEDGEDFDDEDDDEDAPPKRGKGSNPAVPNNPECKQQ